MSSLTYQINRDNNLNLSPQRNQAEFEICRAGKEKDKLISQLKSKIFELELHQKDYDTLNERYNQLQKEFSDLNDCKNLLECEKNKRDGEFNKHINELQCENENLQIGFNEKLSGNKNLYSQNNILGKQIELKNSEICNLTSKLNDLENQLNRNDEDRNNLQKILSGLIDIKNSQDFKISQLLQDNKTLNQICQEQEQNLKMGNDERGHMANELDEKNNIIKDLNCQIRNQVNNINSLQNQLNKCENMNNQYQNNIKDYERQADSLKAENENLKNNLINENSIRAGEGQKSNELNNILNDRDQKINQLCQDIDNIKRMQQDATNENNVLQDENTKLRNHIMNLTEQNQNLINEIDNVIDEDDKMQAILNRQDRISSLLMSNRSTIDQSLNNLDECINRGNYLACKTLCNNTC